MITQPARNEAADLAVELASQHAALEETIAQLVHHSHEELCQARDALAQHLLHHPDDYAATTALQSIYRAIAAKGWPLAVDWRKEVKQPKRRRRSHQVRRQQTGPGNVNDGVASPTGAALPPRGWRRRHMFALNRVAIAS